MPPNYAIVSLENGDFATHSSETRVKMVHAAIEVFGALGYEGASTRTLAERAEVNLAAIPYHFGGKRGLYLAAAQVIADYARERMEPVVVRLRDAKTADHATRIDEALNSFIHLVVGSDAVDAKNAMTTAAEAVANATRAANDAARETWEKGTTKSPSPGKS